MVWYPGKNVISGIKSLGHNWMENRRDRQALKGRVMGDPGPAPQVAGAGFYGADRGAQLDALNMAREGAMGQGPSLAGMAAQAGAQRNVVDQMGMAAMGSGGSLAAQQRQAQGIGAAGAMAGSRDAAMAQLAEQQANQAAFMNQANTMAGMSGGMAGQNADLAAQWGLGQRGLDLETLNSQRQNRQGWVDRGIGALGGIAQGAAMFSDERLKTDIRDASGEAGETLASLEPIGYRYKNERHGPTDEETIGFRAQDLRKTKAGRRVVFDVPGEGLAVDVPGLTSLLAAHGADIERRVRKMEGDRG